MSEHDRDDQQAPRPTTPPERPDPAETTATSSTVTTEREPDPSEVSELARRRDPSLQHGVGTAGRWDARGVAWMRPTDLVAQSSARWAGRGISFEAELARRMRRLPLQATAASRSAITERARRSPSLPGLGRHRAPSPTGTARSGIGFG